MTAEPCRQEFTTEEEFVRNDRGRHGIDRSLWAMWQLFHGASPVPLPAPADSPRYRG
jgi:hypothetical protein